MDFLSWYFSLHSYSFSLFLFLNCFLVQSVWVCAAIFNTLLVSDFAFKGFQNKNNKNKSSCRRSLRWNGFFPSADMLWTSPCSLFKLISPLPRGPFPPSAVPMPSDEDDAWCVVLRALCCGCAGLGDRVTFILLVMEGTEGACAEQCQKHPSLVCCSCRTCACRLLDFGSSLVP